MDKKVCYVCGHPIQDKEMYYRIGPNSYVCSNPQCYDFYFWDNLMAKFVADKNHQYCVIGDNLYYIDNEKERGNNLFYTIQFEDGVVKKAWKLWFITTIPEARRHVFKTNAHFI